MNKNSKRINLYILLLALITGAAVTLRTVACFYHLDYSNGYFGAKGVITASYITVAVGVLIMLSYMFVAKNEQLKPSFTSAATYIPTGIVAAALVFICITLLSQAGENGLYMITHTERVINPTSVLQLMCGLLAILSVVHFFLNAFLPQNKTDLRAHFALATVLFLAFYSIYLYFDSTKLPINTSGKIIDQMAHLSCALFFLYEARISLGREKWRPYVCFGLISALLAAYSSIPSLIIYIFKGEAISASIEENILQFTLFIFITVRIILTASLPCVDRNKQAVQTLFDYAERRQIAVDQSSAGYAEAFAVQMTIEDLMDVANANLLADIELDPSEEDIPLSEAENTEDLTVGSTLFEEDTLLTNNDGSQIELSYEIFEKSNFVHTTHPLEENSAKKTATDTAADAEI